MKSEIARRFFAGIWFAVAAAVPVVFYFLLFGEGAGQFKTGLVLFPFSPILIAGLCGFFLGSSILDAEEVKTVFQAILRGLLVAFLSYLLLFTVSALILAFDNKDLLGTIAFLGIIFLYGLFFVGWLIALVGGAAGGLLFLFGLKKSADGRESEENKQENQ